MTTNQMQLFWFIYLFLISLHVSGDVFVHHQELLTVCTASDIVYRYCCWLVSWMSWNLVLSHQLHQPAAISVDNIRSCIYSQVLLMMGDDRPKHVELIRNK